MNIGEVIRKHRKARGWTQETLANYLGVTTPAVNKWESGSTMPDITLLAPIARLLDVSLDELLSFREELTQDEIRALVRTAEQKFAQEPYGAVFLWVREQIRLYPNCEPLIHALALELEAYRPAQECPEGQDWNAFILSCHERLLASREESMRTAAADALYRYHLRRGEYEKAGSYLDFFSMQNPERKRKKAVLYDKTGQADKAFQTYEELLLADYQILSAVFSSLSDMQLKSGDPGRARYYVEKKQALDRLFEMGDYLQYMDELELVQAEQDRDKTLACVEGLLAHMDSVHDFYKAPLYAHIAFKPVDPAFGEAVRNGILEELRAETGFSYMEGDPRWARLLAAL